MSLLAKSDIRKLLESQNVFESDGGKITQIEQQIQPASIDVTIGQIFIPPLAGSDNDPDGQEVIVCNDFYDLKPGSVALVKSEERIVIPSNLGGFVFPKNGDFALKAVLFTNFGHIDPGFKGHLKFTVINMGKTNFKLKRGERIAGLVLFSLSAPTPPYIPKFDAESFYSHAKTLPRVFLDIDARVAEGVKAQAKAEWSARESKNLLLAIGTAVLATAIGLGSLIGPVAFSVSEKFYTLGLDLKKLEQKVESLKPESNAK
jgi:dCTP deaminase